MRKALYILALAAVSTVPGWAGPVLTVDDANGNIGTVDVVTGVVTFIGPSSIFNIPSTPGPTFTDIAYSPSGSLYGVTFDKLYTISTTTGLASLVGGLGATRPDINSLVFSSTGTLYTASDTLYTINTATGVATALPNQLGAGIKSAGDLAFLNGKLYLTALNGNLYTVDTTTGLATLVGALNPPPPASDATCPPGGTAICNMFGLANSLGTLYGISGTKIYFVNPTTGEATFDLDYSTSPSNVLHLLSGDVPALVAANGTTFLTEAQVPEPATSVLMGMGLLALGLSARFVRNRKQA